MYYMYRGMLDIIYIHVPYIYLNGLIINNSTQNAQIFIIFTYYIDLTYYDD